MVRRRSPIRFALAALLALALASLGAAHPGAPAGEQDRMIAAFVQAGGSLDDLCLTDPDSTDHAAHSDCPLCTLATSLALAAPPALPVVTLRATRLGRTDHRPHLADSHAPRAPPARGPPIALV